MLVQCSHFSLFLGEAHRILFFFFFAKNSKKLRKKRKKKKKQKKRNKQSPRDFGGCVGVHICRNFCCLEKWIEGFILICKRNTRIRLKDYDCICVFVHIYYV